MKGFNLMKLYWKAKTVLKNTHIEKGHKLSYFNTVLGKDQVVAGYCCD